MEHPVAHKKFVGHEEVEAEEKTGLTSTELEELKQLRKDKARLEMEVEILGKATAFFAKRNQ